MEQTATLTRPRPLVLADLLPGERLRDVVLVAGAAAFVGALAQASFHLAGTPVPVTGQTLGVLLAGCTLGFRRAVASSALYAGLGFLGVPWFVGHTSGWQGASTGYLLGFLLASGLCGRLAERGADRSVWRSLPTMLAGEVCIYAAGVTWLAVDLHVGPAKALSMGFTPFVAGDALKMALAAGLLPAAWRLATPRRH